MLQVSLEKFGQVYDELYPHLLNQYYENEPYAQELDLDPAKSLYQLLEDQGNLWIVVAREMGAIVGYVIVLTQLHLHHQTVMIGSIDIFYVIPEKRSTGVAVELLEYVEKLAALSKIKWLRIGMKTEQKFAKLLDSRGYKEDEVVFCLSLEK